MTDSTVVTFASYLFPTTRNPVQAIFVKDEVEQFSKNSDLSVKLFIPSPYKLPFSSGKITQKQIGINSNLPVINKNYLSIPRQFFPKVTQQNICKAFSSYLNNHHTDLFHLHFLFPTGLAIPFLKSKGKGVVITVHGTDWYTSRRSKLHDEMLKESLKAADKVIVVGDDLYADIKSELGSKVDIVTLHHGIDTTFFKPLNNSQNIEVELGNKSNIKLLCVANLVRKKGLHVLLNALSEIENKDWKLTIIYNAVDKDYKNELEQIINRSEIDDRVNFMKSVSRTSLRSYFQSCDIYIQPSLNEPFGLSLAECIACGKPAISTKQGGPRDIINKINGLLVKPNDTIELATAITTLLDNFDTYDPFELHSDIKNRFSIAKKISYLNQLYKSIV